MKTNKREFYLAPQCLIVQVSETNYLMDTSFPSQHRPARRGTGPAAQAKSFGLWSDENSEVGNSGESSSSWDD